MNGFLFNAGIRQTRSVKDRGVQTWDACVSAIVYGSDAGEAQTRFEEWCLRKPEDDPKAIIQIKRIVAAQLVDQLLSESGASPLDWRQIAGRALDPDALSVVDESEQGLWVDVNSVAPAGQCGLDLESFRRQLSEEISSGLNWLPERQTLYLVSVLSPPPPPPDPDAQYETEQLEPQGDEPDQPAEMADDLDEFTATLPDMRQKETAALIEARNAVAAGWIWRKFSADTQVAANEIHVGQCCPIFPAEPAGSPSQTEP
jgi:hypothetical protein